MAARDRLRLTARLLAAASLLAFAATGAVAQAKDPNATVGEANRNSIECPEGQVPSAAMAGQPCAPDTAQPGGGSTSVPPNAVFLPDILVDLFPNPPGMTGRETGGGDGSTARETTGDDPVDPNGSLVADSADPDPDPDDGDQSIGRTADNDTTDDGSSTRIPSGGSDVPSGGGGTSGGDGSSSAGGAGGTSLPTGGGGAGGPISTAAGAAGLARPLTVSPQAISGDFVPDEVLVTIDGDAALVGAVAADFGLEVRSQRLSGLLGVTVARLGIPDGRPVGVVLAQLASDPRTIDRVPNHVYDLQQAAGVVNYAFQRIALEPATATGEDISIAVIDTAVDDKHEVLAGVVREIYDAMPDTPIVERNHGTSVSGLIAGIGTMRGMAPGSDIYHARAFEGGKSTMAIILDALDWAAAKDVRIINMSFVGPKNDLMKSACASARARGLVLVAAAGNNGPKAPYGYPAAYDGVIAVTATDERDALMPQANRGPYVYVSAPGVNMLAPVGGGADLVTGTSFAAAIVSGAIANLLHENPDRSVQWIEKALAETSGDLGPAGRDSDFGFGLVNTQAARALK